MEKDPNQPVDEFRTRILTRVHPDRREVVVRRYEMLGELRVVTESGDHSLSVPKVKILLATLLIRAGQVVPADQLVAELWNGRPPRCAAAALYVYVSQVRKFLCVSGESSSPVVTRSPGYMLQLGTDTLDLHLFQKELSRGCQHLHLDNYAQAVTECESALSRWRSSALGGLQGGFIINDHITWLEESRLVCLETLIEAKLGLQRHHESLSQLYSLIAEYPLRESFYQLLIIALCRSERRAEALSVYDRGWSTITRELAVEPGDGFQRIRQSILDETCEIRGIRTPIIRQRVGL
ncbi:DNA-binding transcriptional activator of the SARP family [Frankia torreyi]|uniref:DNA-binding transcriptional activator of the SARP family n=3 Tax=Frankia TaxID=1854 RepID=A0A0D8B8B9_9ACTN|nr:MULTISPECIES: AfsR/SARP family transcriptional regulator [Frankia]KJE20179.1 DNA-binding transcriptional activator of the SARP family [Frankia torreyi]